MENKIFNKKCFIKAKDNFVYCSKCGKRQLQDTYNLGKHTKDCHFFESDFNKVFKENEDFSYGFLVKKDILIFIVFTPKLIPIRGFNDRFQGGEWKEVFRATFKRGSKEVIEKGLYHVDYWFKHCLDGKKILCLNNEPAINFIKLVFPDILFIESFGAFLDFYRNKGFGNKKLLSDEKANEILEKKLFDKNITKRSLRQIRICGELINVNEDLILHLEGFDDYSKVKIFSCLVSEGYAYTNTSVDFLKKYMIQANYPIINDIDVFVLEEFDKKYPSFMVKHYLDNGGKNILIPLFCANYNKCLELLYKAGMIDLAENFKELKENNNFILYKNNIREIFGLPVKTLKRLVDKDNIGFKNFVNILSEIYIYNKNILNIDRISDLAARFLIENNITHKTNFEKFYTTFDGIDDWTDEDIIRTIKYLNKLEEVGRYASYNTYRDYIDMCIKIKEFVCGRWPKDLEYAHDLASMKYELNKNKYLDERFKNAIKNYTHLSSLKGEEKENFEEDKYMIIIPKSSLDLVRESSQLHHCVKTYIDRVASGRTFILFLREKENKDKSFATIEVLPNLNLIQLKAVNNTKAPKEAQEFVKKWAKIKCVKINSHDII